MAAYENLSTLQFESKVYGDHLSDPMNPMENTPEDLNPTGLHKSPMDWAHTDSGPAVHHDIT